MESNDNSTINNRYNILEKKGKGASASVYLVEKQDDKKQYAAKVLNEVTPLFQKEIAILDVLSKLKCPYLVNLIEFGEGPIKIGSKPTQTKQYLILDYASKGETFDYLVSAQRGLEERHAKLFFKKILEGVQTCHVSGICHRDLKMQNILLDDVFNPKICDFGFATEIKGNDGSGKLTDYLGTINYAAPEIFLHKPYDGLKADIFSLGVVLINLVTSKIGFVQATRKDKYYKLIIIRNYQAYWNRVEGQLGHISQELKSLYQKMICFNPDERPTIEEIFQDPWMREITNMNDEQLKQLEKEVYLDFMEREQKVIESNEKIESESLSDILSGGDRGLEEEEKEFFPDDLTPKYYEKTGFNMNKFMKITGNLNPTKFMNALANKIKNEYSENCDIEADEGKLKFKAIFRNEEGEEEENEEDKKIEEELDKLGLKNIDDFEDTIEKKDSVIQVKLLQSMNGGHLVKFSKKGGEIEDYHRNLKKIIDAIKQII